LERIMHAVDVMSPRVIAVHPDAPVSQAAELMLRTGVSGLPVQDTSGALVGILTEGDLLRRVELGTQRRRSRLLAFLTSPGRLAEEYTHSQGRKVSEVMSREVETVDPESQLSDVVDLMLKRRIKRVPVVRDGVLMGIVSRADLMRALAKAAQAECLVDPDDARIRRRVIASLESEPWAPIALVNPEVHGGEVELRGTILDERQREALRVLVENVPGVRAVHDHLVWVEPQSGLVLLDPNAAEDAAKTPAAA
jgi:CBS domain-containing protein